MSAARDRAERAFEPEPRLGRPRAIKVGKRVLLPSGAFAEILAIGEDAGGELLELRRDDGELLDIRPSLLRWPDGAPL